MIRFQPDQDMLYRYVQRKLLPAEEEQVELWLMDHPDAVEELALDLMLQEGMAEIRPKATSVAQSESPPWLGWLTRPAFAGATAMAVLAAIATPTGLYLAANERNTDLVARLAQLEQRHTGLRSAMFVDLPITRGSPSTDAVVSLSAGDTRVVFRLFVSDPDFSSYLIRIASDDSVIAEQDQLQVGADSSLVISLDASLLSDKFQLQVFGERDGELTQLNTYVVESH